jgi:hypothetical protein
VSFTINFLDQDEGDLGSFYAPCVPRFGERVQIDGRTLFVNDVVYRAAGNDLRCAFVTLSPPATDEPFHPPLQAKEV